MTVSTYGHVIEEIARASPIFNDNVACSVSTAMPNVL